MKEAFSGLDIHQTGSIGEKELRHIMQNLGDPLSQQEVVFLAFLPSSFPYFQISDFLLLQQVNEIMKGVKVGDNGRIDYNEFVSYLVNSYPVAKAKS